MRRIGGNKQPAAPILPSFDEPTGRRRLSGRVLPLLIGGIALAVIIAGLIVITNTGGGTTTGQVVNTNTSQTGAGLHNKQTKPVVFKPSHVKVAVLNGTAQSGLAGDVGTKLAGEGYRKGNITNAASQTEGLTFVYYKPRQREQGGGAACRKGAHAPAVARASSGPGRAPGLRAQRLRRIPGLLHRQRDGLGWPGPREPRLRRLR